MTIHREPFVHLAGLTHDDALIAWGAFFFVDADGDRGWRIVEDPDLGDVVEGTRQESIGVASRPYGDAQVEVVDLVSGQVAARRRRRSATTSGCGACSPTPPIDTA